MLTIGRKFPRSYINSLTKRNLKNNFCTAQHKLTEDSVEEIRIPVPWGHVAGKWWGDKSIIPVVAIHGWQDNANTFDKLIPLLNIPSIISIDLPGHGLSSHFPDGIAYDFEEYLIVLHRIIKHYNWTRVPLLTHSFGGALGYAYSSMFPDKVKWLIGFECGRSLLTLQKANLPYFLSKEINTLLKIEKQKKEKSVPAYKLSTMVRMTIEGSLGSISSPEAALTLLKRGMYPVPKPSNPTEKVVSYGSDLQQFLNVEKQAASSLPEKEKKHLYEIYLTAVETLNKAREEMKNFHVENDDKYYSFTRDPSIKVQVFDTFDEDCLREASKNIKCPVLSMRARYGFLHGSTKKLYEETLHILKASSSYLEHHEVDGSHHAHLNKPEPLANVINSFLQKLPAEFKE